MHLERKIMIKLYFKKLLLMLIYVIICFLIYYVGFSILATLANFFEAPIIRYGVMFGIPAIIILIIIYKHRIEKKEMRRSYLERTNKEKLILKNEFLYMFRFPDFLTEIFSFTTIILPAVIAIGIGNQAPWWADVFAGTIILCILVSMFFVLDFIFWMIVHIAWRKRS